jgi:hypothetical protein
MDSQDVQRAANNATTWLNLIWESELSSGAKLVACYLRTFMNDYQDTAWPSQSRIAKYTGCGVRSVDRHLKSLCEAGFLQHMGTERAGGTIRYGIINPALVAEGGSAMVAEGVCHGGEGGSAMVADKLNNITKQVTKAHRDALERFEDFWKSYPLKKDKQKARAKFLRLTIGEQLRAMEDVKLRAKGDPDWTKEDGKYVPYPTTYLNGSRWEDQWKKGKKKEFPFYV